MTWTIEFDNRARKELRKLDPDVQKRILDWITDHLAECTDPRETGSALKGTLKGLWRYRVGDYRIVTRIEDDKILILILRIAHRREVYD